MERIRRKIQEEPETDCQEAGRIPGGFKEIAQDHPCERKVKYRDTWIVDNPVCVFYCRKEDCEYKRNLLKKRRNTNAMLSSESNISRIKRTEQGLSEESSRGAGIQRIRRKKDDPIQRFKENRNKLRNK